MKRQRHAEIAGAGFAGIAAAIALRQRGWTVRVHEADRELRAFGAGIFIWENGLRVLRALGAYDAAMAGAHEAPLYEARNNRNEKLSVENFNLARGSRMITMTRQHLFNALFASAERLGVEFRTGSVVTGASPEGTLSTADGKVWPADFVIGADGVKSSVRDALGLLKERQRFEQGVIRLLVPRGTDDLDGDGADNVINFWSPRYRILYVPCNPTELYILLSAHHTDTAATALPVNKPLWIEAFPFLEPVLSRIGTEGRYDAYEMSSLTRWSSGKVAVIGDASHAMPPTIGQGAGCAMMNALALAVMLEDDSVEAALPRWETAERPLTEHTQHISAVFAQIRAGADGKSKWDDEALRTARSIPTGTEPRRHEPVG